MLPQLQVEVRPFPFTLCRLGLATRGGAGITADDVELALERGVNFLNWCGQPDGLSQAISALGKRRRNVAVCLQFEARTAAEAKSELATSLRELGTDTIDVLAFYYVEQRAEWQQIAGPGGALEYCRAAQADGVIGMLGLTSHQRPLAAGIADSGVLDMLMIRYNAAHRGAEREVFPITDRLHMPVVVYTCLRWGALLRGTPDDPPGFQPPTAPAWYEFVLRNPSVTVALMAPENRRELEENLSLLAKSSALTTEEFAALAAHGKRVRRHAGGFP